MNIKKKNYYIKYTLLFVCFASFIVFSYYSIGKSMINYGADGYRQHFRGLVYTSSFLKELFNNFFIEKNFIIPQWDFAIGEGADILQAIHYYGFGDPIHLISIFIPQNKLYLFYDFGILLRMYLSGVFFSEFCFYQNKFNAIAVLSGALLYAFSGYAIDAAGTHIYFLNGCMYLPLVIFGIEKIIKENNGILLSISVTLTAISSIYFFYMIVVATVIYVIVRVLTIKLTIKEKIQKIVYITLYSLLGVIISSVIFLPTFYFMISNSRVGASIPVDMFNPLSFYLEKIRSIVFANGYFGDYSIIGLFSIILLFINRNNKMLIVLFILGISFVSLPFFGKMFNGFSYYNERWEFIFGFLMIYLIVYNFDDFIKFVKKHMFVSLFILIAYFMLCIYLNIVDIKVYLLFMIVGIVSVLIISKHKSEFWKQFICLGLCIFNIAFSIFFKYSPLYWDFGIRGTNFDIAEKVMKGEFSAFDDIEEKGFYRYSGDSLVVNECVQGDISSTQYYWSVSNDNVIEFRKLLGLSDHNNHHYDSYDDDYILNSLASVKYYIKKNNDIVPYKYYDIGTHSGYNVYKTDFTLPLVYSYDSYININDWNKYDVLLKRESLSQSMILEENDYRLIEKEPISYYENIDYTVKTNDVILENNKMKVLETNGTLSLSTTYNKAGEYYLIIEGLDAIDSSDIVVNLYNGTSKNLFFRTKTYAGYAGHHDFAINLGYLDSICGDITIEFPDKLDFDYKNIRIAYLPLEDIDNNLRKLNDIDINKLDISQNKVEADISTRNEKMLCFAIPYSNGWKAYVDDNEINIVKANIQYIGIPINSGEHIIKLEYSTPLLKEGFIMSSIGIATLLAIIIYNSKKIYK